MYFNRQLQFGISSMEFCINVSLISSTNWYLTICVGSLVKFTVDGFCGYCVGQHTHTHTHTHTQYTVLFIRLAISPI